MVKNGGEEGGGTDSGVRKEPGMAVWVLLCGWSVGGEGVVPCGG
jgi:hypothetical protein